MAQMVLNCRTHTPKGIQILTKVKTKPGTFLAEYLITTLGRETTLLTRQLEILEAAVRQRWRRTAHGHERCHSSRSLLSKGLAAEDHGSPVHQGASRDLWLPVILVQLSNTASSEG